MKKAIEEARASTGSNPGGSGAAPPSADGVTVGLLTIVVGTLSVMAAVGEVFPDAMVFVAVFIGLAVWAHRSGSTRLRWAISGLAAVFLTINLVFAIGDLSHPESPAPFIATAVVIGGGLVTIVLAVMAARGRARSGRRVWPIAYLGLGLIAAGSLIAAAGVDDDTAQQGDTEVVANAYEFPDEVIAGSDSTGVFLRNEDRGRHTFAVEDAIDAVEMPAGSQVRVPLDLEPGSYRYFCDIVGHEDMEGTLIIE